MLIDFYLTIPIEHADYEFEMLLDDIKEKSTSFGFTAYRDEYNQKVVAVYSFKAEEFDEPMFLMMALRHENSFTVSRTNRYAKNI